MVARLSLVCHGSTTALRTASFPADETLDDHAHRALAAIADGTLCADRTWASPALRARQTAQALKLDAVIEPRLRECDYGTWTGCSLDDVQARQPAAVLAWLSDPAVCPHGGESVLDLLHRVGEWLDAQREIAGRTIAVTHASVIRAAITHAIGAQPQSYWRIDIPPLSLTSLTGHHGRWTLRSVSMKLAERKPDPAHAS